MSLNDHRATAEAAGLTVMAEVLDIVWNRLEGSRHDGVLDDLSSLSIEEVGDLYVSFVAPAIDQIEKRIVDEHRRNCR